MFWTYVLENPAGRFYIGSTSDLKTRIGQHNSDIKIKTKFTHKHGPWKLVWKEPHPTRCSAMNREKQIKSMKSTRWIREKLINSQK
ncbi:MAG: GIY-YIG nuclease family protein [Planctomycetota bacterium]